MNGAVFMNWVQHQLLPYLTTPTVVVMDNASYHSMLDPERRQPTSAWKKKQIQDWLTSHDIPFDVTLTKPELYVICKRNRVDPIYSIDNMISASGQHKVLRLPAYHCDLNPIELIWSQVKRRVAEENCHFTLKKVLELTKSSISKVTAADWQSCVRHTTTIEQEYMRLDGIIQRIQPIVIRLDSSSSSSSSEDSED